MDNYNTMKKTKIQGLNGANIYDKVMAYYELSENRIVHLYGENSGFILW